MEPLETPTSALELLIGDRALYDKEDLLRDTLNGDELETALDTLRTDNPGWVDNQRRVEALKQGTTEAPTPETIVESWVERGHVVDEFTAGASESKVWLVDNIEAYQWALDNGLLTDDGGLPDGDWNVPVLRINARWRAKDAAYDSIASDDQEARAAYLAANEDYRKDRRRRDGFDIGVPDQHIETFVDYYELPGKGFEQERFLAESKDDPDGYYQQVWLGAQGNAPIDFDKVPSVEVESLLEKYFASPSVPKSRLIMRHRNPSLERWLVDIEGYKPVGDRWMEAAPSEEKPKTPTGRSRFSRLAGRFAR